MCLQDTIFNVVMLLLDIKDKLIERFEKITEKQTKKFNKQIKQAENLVIETNTSKDKYLVDQGNKRTQMMIKGK